MPCDPGISAAALHDAGAKSGSAGLKAALGRWKSWMLRKLDLPDVAGGMQDAQEQDAIVSLAKIETVFAKRMAAAAWGQFGPGTAIAVMTG